MTYEEYVRDFITKSAKELGSLRKLSVELGVDVSILSKIASGKYVPKKKTFEKWFGSIPEDIEFSEKYDGPQFVFSQDMKSFIETLDRLGYRIEIIKKES